MWNNWEEGDRCRVGSWSPHPGLPPLQKIENGLWDKILEPCTSALCEVLMPQRGLCLFAEIASGSRKHVRAPLSRWSDPWIFTNATGRFTGARAVRTLALACPHGSESERGRHCECKPRRPRFGLENVSEVEERVPVLSLSWNSPCVPCWGVLDCHRLGGVHSSSVSPLKSWAVVWPLSTSLKGIQTLNPTQPQRWRSGLYRVWGFPVTLAGAQHWGGQHFILGPNCVVCVRPPPIHVPPGLALAGGMGSPKNST